MASATGCVFRYRPSSVQFLIHSNGQRPDRPQARHPVGRRAPQLRRALNFSRRFCVVMLMAQRQSRASCTSVRMGAPVGPLAM